MRTNIPRFVCLQVLLSRDLPHPFGLTVFEQYVYWTDWDTGNIERAHKVDGSSRRTVASGLDSLMDLHMFHRDRPDGKQYRTVNNVMLCCACGYLHVNALDIMEMHACDFLLVFGFSGESMRCG